MISVSNLKIDFKKTSSKQNLKKNEVNVLFLDNFKEIKFKPVWLNNEIEKFLIQNSKSRKIKHPYLFETQFGLFLIIPILKKTNDYSLDIENQGGLIFDKISTDFYSLFYLLILLNCIDEQVKRLISIMMMIDLYQFYCI